MADDRTEDLLADASARASRYLAGLATRPVFPDAGAIAGLEELGDGLPARGSNAADTLALLDRVGSPATVASAGGRYFGFVTGGALPATVAASYLARAWDQNTGMAVMSPAANHIDALALRWLVELFGLPESTGGAFVTGATMANASALLAARNHLLADAGWDVDAMGLFGAPEIRVLVGAEAHSSIFKALSIVGLGRARVELLAVDDQGAIDAATLPDLDQRPTLVCMQAGNVNTGAFDPAGAITGWATGANAWVHVDGAFGLWAEASARRRHLTEGLATADSWASDAHKWLNVPYDCGFVLVREPEHLAAAFTQAASYLPPAAGRDPLAFTPESSQRARGVEVWAALHHLGRAGLAELIDGCCDLAERAADGLSASGLRVLNDVVLNQVLFAAGDDEGTDRLLATVQAEGTAWMGPTRWHGRSAIRLSVSSWATTAEDIDATVAAVSRCLAEMG